MRNFFMFVVFVAIAVLISIGYSNDKDNFKDVPWEIYQYNDHLYKISSNTVFQLNIFASIGHDGILLVDTGMPLDGPVLYDALRSISDKPIELIIITHSHLDHIGGMPVLGKGTKVIVHKNSIYDEYYSLPKRRIFDVPTMAVDTVMNVHFNGEDIDVIPVPAGHYNGELIVHFKDSNVLCTGSRIIPGSYPYGDLKSGCTLEELVDGPQHFAETYPDAVFATGHGKQMNSKEVKVYYDKIKSSVDLIKRELASGKTAEEIIESKILAPWDDFTTGFVSHAAWIDLINRSMTGTQDNKPDMAALLTEKLEADGVDAMIDYFQTLEKAETDDYTYGEVTLNMLGYQLVYRKRFDEAFKIFDLYTQEFPSSANAYDSYAEAYLTSGNKTKAIELYKKALEVNPEFENAKAMLKSLQ